MRLGHVSLKFAEPIGDFRPLLRQAGLKQAGGFFC